MDMDAILAQAEKQYTNQIDKQVSFDAEALDKAKVIAKLLLKNNNARMDIAGRIYSIKYYETNGKILMVAVYETEHMLAGRKAKPIQLVADVDNDQSLEENLYNIVYSLINYVYDKYVIGEVE